MEAARANWTDDRIDDLASRLTAFEARVEVRFDGLESRIDSRFDRFEARVDERIRTAEEKIDKRFDKIDERFDALDGRLEAMDARSERRFDLLQNSLIIAMATMFATVLAAVLGKF